MSDQKLQLISFSPTGGTEKILRAAALGISRDVAHHDLLKAAPKGETIFGPERVALIGMPVFAGRLPALAAERLQCFHGRDCPAVLMVVYGNRAYEDALVELNDLAENRGFRPVAAAAFVALTSWKAPAWAVVIAASLIGWAVL